MIPKNIQINNQIVLIIGPTTSGKTTLAHRIQKQYHASSKIISQDDILNQEDKSQNQESLDSILHQKMASLIKDTVHDDKNQLIILDTLNIGMHSVSSLISTIKEIGYPGKFTLLKNHPSIELHRSFCETRNDSMAQSLTQAGVKDVARGQRLYYESNHGSLKAHYPYSEEYIILDPTTVNFSFHLGSHQYYKTK